MVPTPFTPFFGQVILFMLLTTSLLSTYITSFSTEISYAFIILFVHVYEHPPHITQENLGPIIMELYFTDHTCHPSNSYFCT